jgi:hypothetical protein
MENYAYEYDGDFKFVKRHVLDSGFTLVGIQTAAFANDHWWFGCYGEPKILLKADAVADRPDSTAQSKAFAKALQDVGVDATVVPGEGKNHGTINRDMGVEGDKPTKAVFEFREGLRKK